MEPESSLSHLQVPAVCPCPGPDQSSSYPSSHFLNILNIILQFTPGSTKRSLSHRFPTQTLYTSLLSPIRAACPTHLILLDFMTILERSTPSSSLVFSPKAGFSRNQSPVKRLGFLTCSWVNMTPIGENVALDTLMHGSSIKPIKSSLTESSIFVCIPW